MSPDRQWILLIILIVCACATKESLTLHAFGKGVIDREAPNTQQALLRAERAALADGYRKLAESITGVYLLSRTKTGINGIDYDTIKIETNAYLKGVEIINTQIQDGFSVVHLRVRIPAWSEKKFP